MYPEALSLMPFPWVWCIFFFLMMITIGFGSLLSLAECVLSSLILIFNIKNKKTDILMRLAICLGFFILGVSMTTKVVISFSYQFSFKFLTFFFHNEGRILLVEYY